jgi:formylmethanofuran dehydrogenase subunit B
VTDHVTCLGCGLLCDDISVIAQGGMIVEARNACPLGVRWFGDGRVPTRARVGASDVDAARALDAAATLLGAARRPLVYLAPDMANDTYGAATAIADVLHALLDTVTTVGVTGDGVLAGQVRGRTTATFSELRNRADVIVFWGVDPGARYPRFQSRIAPGPAGLFLTGARRVIAVDIGSATGPTDATERVAFSAADEAAALAHTRAAVVGNAVAPSPLATTAAALATALTSATYLALVIDGEASPNQEALLALSEALNGPTRCAITVLRAGGNRVGADAVLTWQTGYPMAVDFARGVPRYVPLDGADKQLARGAIDVALIVGSAAGVPDAVRAGLGTTRCIVIGPRASESPFATAVALDTGIAGIHDGGVGARADDIPLPLRVPLPNVAPSASAMVRALLAKVATR